VFPSGRNPGSDGRKDLIEDGIKPGPWTVGLYDILARVSGRYLTASLNTLIWTMMHTTHFYFQECVFARKRWIDFGGTHEWLMWLHRKSGVLVGCALLPHIWSILLPCIFNGYGVQMREPSEFEWPLSEATMSGAPKDVDNDKKMMGLQYDDVWRLVEMTLMFAVFIPWSLTLLSKDFRWGIVIHRLIYVMYFIDIVRRHSHPHNWVLNGPVFLMWMADVYVGWHWKKGRSLAERQILSADYMVLNWSHTHTLDTAGPEFLLKLAFTSWSEWRHPFTGFMNRGKLACAPQQITEPSWQGQLFMVEDGCLVRNYERDTTSENTDIVGWTCGTVIRIYHGKASHTRAIAEAADPVIDCWGPFEGSMSADIYRRMKEEDPVVVVAGGSGAGYLLDCIQQHMVSGKSPALFLYTTRDVGLFQWFTWMYQTMQERNVEQGGDGAQAAAKAFTVVALTAKGVAVAGEGLELTNGIVQLGRLDFMAQFQAFHDKKCRVYVQGGAGLQASMKKACDLHGCSLTAGASYDNVSPKKNSKEAVFANLSKDHDATKHSTKGLTDKSRISIIQHVKADNAPLTTAGALDKVVTSDIPDYLTEQLTHKLVNATAPARSVFVQQVQQTSGTSRQSLYSLASEWDDTASDSAYKCLDEDMSFPADLEQQTTPQATVRDVRKAGSKKSNVQAVNAFKGGLGKSSAAVAEAAETRGACSRCGAPVLVSQEREQDPATGLYYHTDTRDCADTPRLKKHSSRNAVHPLSPTDAQGETQA